MDISKIRNFCIIAHIDHGKSTLSDRLIEITNTVEKRKLEDQFLDNLDLEKERGITIKLQTVRMIYRFNNEDYVLNLIDTPGHVDFSYEVSRSMAACEGAILLIDATQGIEAQTISNAFKAMEHNLKIIPVVNKIDLPNAEPEKRAIEVCETFGFDLDEILFVSGKTGEGVDSLLHAIVNRIPAPKQHTTLDSVQALIFDSFFDEYKGVVALVRIMDGFISQDDLQRNHSLYLYSTNLTFNPIEVGYLKPNLSPSKCLYTGEVGYVATGEKNIRNVQVGDTITFVDNKLPKLPGYKRPKSMVYASLYPVDANQQTELRESLEKLALNDSSLNFVPEYSKALGSGFRCGFLGLLHMDVVQERLEREYSVDLILTAPSVEYKVKLKSIKTKNNNYKPSDFDENGLLTITTASDLPDMSMVDSILEPWMKVEIVTAAEYIGDVMKLCSSRRSIYKNTEYIGSTANMSRVILHYEMPLIEIINDFFDNLKSVTHGYASLDYSFIEYRVGDIVKVDILINNEKVDALSFLIDRSQAMSEGRRIVENLKKLIPKHLFKIPLQATIGGKIIAREDIPAIKKDVLKVLSGGDHTRKLKQLEKQKEGKKRLKMYGKVSIPQEAFLSILKKS
ncbi:MAG: translation elongation factor 4 [Candidatus Dojkabacteria bacterium]|nr:translation elongation factor 4 [Candidatus Dojkabacteria bacterium]